MPGKLFLCATPIGNLGDITYRVVEALKNADIIAAEDTRNSIKLLNHFDIHVPMTSYHEYNKIDKGRVLVAQMQEGKNVALITDAGTPGISDPGEELVKMCIDAGIEVSPLPGPAACISALIISGFSTRRFCFEGFLPNEKEDKKGQKAVLERLKTETRTTVFYEAPHRFVRTLKIMCDAVGPDRRVAVCRELTKKHETVFRGSISQTLTHYTENAPKGEIVLVVEGVSQKVLDEERHRAWQDISIEEHMKMYMEKGLTRKDAMKSVASDRGISRKEVYNYMVDRKKKD